MLILQIAAGVTVVKYTALSDLVKTSGAVFVLVLWTKENLVAPISVFFLWTRFHAKRESCRSSFCVLSVDKIACQKRILSLQFLCSFCGQDCMPKENLVAPVSVFFLWTRFHARKGILSL